jgi:hypothetical protein
MDNEAEEVGPSLEEQSPVLPDRSESLGKFRDHRNREATKAEGRQAEDTARQTDEGEQASSRSSRQEQAIQLTDLSKRVAELEVEIARLRPEARAAPEESLRSAQIPLAPPYVARAVVAVENHLADMERFAATGDETAAQQAKVAAVIEIQLLQLAGLPEIFAQNHIDIAITAYDRYPQQALERLSDPMAFLSDLRQLRDSSCITADLLSQSIRRKQTRQRLKKLLTFGLSGTLIVAVNSIGTAVLGPVGVAASGALGSAAVGLAAQFLS